MKVKAAVGCNKGRIRSNNEDNFYFNGFYLDQDNDGLNEVVEREYELSQPACFAVLDGVGGAEYGEVASNTAAKSMKMFLSKKGEAKLNGQGIRELVDFANQRVVDKGFEMTSEMGSTLVSLYFSESQGYIFNLGDSKAFEITENGLRQISFDHNNASWVQSQSKKKFAITQFLGLDPAEMIVEPYIADIPFKNGGKYLLCSDGLTDMVSEKDIYEIISNTENLKQCTELLIDAALKNGGRDNVTVILCKTDGKLSTAETSPKNTVGIPAIKKILAAAIAVALFVSGFMTGRAIERLKAPIEDPVVDPVVNPEQENVAKFEGGEVLNWGVYDGHDISWVVLEHDENLVLLSRDGLFEHEFYWDSIMSLDGNQTILDYLNGSVSVGEFDLWLQARNALWNNLKEDTNGNRYSLLSASDYEKYSDILNRVSRDGEPWWLLPDENGTLQYVQEDGTVSVLLEENAVMFIRPAVIVDLQGKNLLFSKDMPVFDGIVLGTMQEQDENGNTHTIYYYVKNEI